MKKKLRWLTWHIMTYKHPQTSANDMDPRSLGHFHLNSAKMQLTAAVQSLLFRVSHTISGRLAVEETEAVFAFASNKGPFGFCDTCRRSPKNLKNNENTNPYHKHEKIEKHSRLKAAFLVLCVSYHFFASLAPRTDATLGFGLSTSRQQLIHLLTVAKRNGPQISIPDLIDIIWYHNITIN